MTHGWSHSHQVPRFQTLCWQNWHLHSQAWLPLNTLMSLGKKKKGKNKHPASPLNPDKGCSVTLPNPSLGYFLISCLIQSFPVWGHGQIHQSHAPMSVSHHFPGGGQILNQQGEQKGWIWGLIVPIQIL